jgi:hypothetical protein
MALGGLGNLPTILEIVRVPTRKFVIHVGMPCHLNGAKIPRITSAADARKRTRVSVRSSIYRILSRRRRTMASILRPFQQFRQLRHVDRDPATGSRKRGGLYLAGRPSHWPVPATLRRLAVIFDNYEVVALAAALVALMTGKPSAAIAVFASRPIRASAATITATMSISSSAVRQ